MTSNPVPDSAIQAYPENVCINVYIGNVNERYVIGEVPTTIRNGEQIFVVIGMNPSAADMEKGDSTVNSLIRHYRKLKDENPTYVGWLLFNLYPERSTDLSRNDFKTDNLYKKNTEIIINLLNGELEGYRYISSSYAPEICIAYGSRENEQLQGGEHRILTKLYEEFPMMNYFAYRDLNKNGSPKHPIRSKWENRIELKLEPSVRITKLEANQVLHVN